MGNGNFCVSVKDFITDRNSTLQNPNMENGIFQNSTNNLSSFYNNTTPNNFNYSNYITINSRKWYKAGPKRNSNLNNLNNKEINNNITFNPKETTFESNNNNLRSINNQYINDYSNYNLSNSSLGDKYIGELYNNLPYGKGKYISSNGEIREGNFVNGKLNGKGKMNLTNGIYLEGNFINDKLNGEG